MIHKALIIFAKFPDTNVKTRLKGFISEHMRLMLYESLLRSTIEKFRRFSGVDVYICFTPKEKENYFLKYNSKLCSQTEGDIGKRMFHAFQDVFNNRYKKAVLIGTDIPSLTKQIVLNAFQALKHNDVVFGPALDGGYYLIGLKKNYADIFEGIQWSTPHTLNQSVEKAKECDLRIGFIDKLSDIDTIEDLRKAGIFSLV